jgi:hypothetical protein
MSYYESLLSEFGEMTILYILGLAPGICCTIILEVRSKVIMNLLKSEDYWIIHILEVVTSVVPFLIIDEITSTGFRIGLYLSFILMSLWFLIIFFTNWNLREYLKLESYISISWYNRTYITWYLIIVLQYALLAIFYQYSIFLPVIISFLLITLVCTIIAILNTTRLTSKTNL